MEDMKSSNIGIFSSSERVISSYPVGSRYCSDRSSSSHFARCMPRRCAMGAYISIVSSDFVRCFSGVWYAIVRILCSRSAILMRMTRISFAIAMSILRRFSICSSSLLVYCTRVSFVTPSTMSATGSPNWRAMSAWVRFVSSITSCSSAATMESSSSPMSTVMSAAATQCVT